MAIFIRTSQRPSRASFSRFASCFAASSRAVGAGLVDVDVDVGFGVDFGFGFAVV
ncbi:hypothetical protein AB0E54_25205 [Amycolatopsis coloradensis]